MSEKQQQLVYAVIDFLRKSVEDGIVKSDDREGLEIAIQCIGEAFNVDPTNELQATKFSIKPATLESIFEVFIKTRDKVGTGTQPSSSSEQSADDLGLSSESRTEAENYKKIGNSHMSEKKYDDAIKHYTKAIDLDSTNPVYYSNRAAAHSSKGDHLSAVGDAERAISLDPKFARAYHRLGHAQYSLSDFRAAESAFERGLQIETDNANLKSGLDNSRKRLAALESRVPLQNLSDLSGKTPGLEDSSIPNLASFMNNPQMMAMAQQLMSNGGLANLMQNPSVANMMNRVRDGDMPQISEFMNDPTLRELANQFTGSTSGGK